MDLFDDSYNDSITRLAAPLDNNNGLASIVSSTLCRAPYIGIITLIRKNNNISEIEFEIVPNTFRTQRKANCLSVLNWLESNIINIIIVPKTDMEAISALERFDIRFVLVEPGRILEEVLRSFK